MTQEGRVEDFWTTRRRSRVDDDNVRPLLKALAAARRTLDEDHYAPPVDTAAPDAVVVDIRPPRSVSAEAIARVDGPERQEPHRESSTPPPDWISVEAPGTRTSTRGWGDLWRESVQGWVRSREGVKIWRPIVTTTTSVPNWEIETNLGMVTGESACALDGDRLSRLLQTPEGVEALRRELAKDRGVAETAMVEDAVARGAHAVIGVKLDYTPLRDCLVVTATGTAVTLRTPR